MTSSKTKKFFLLKLKQNIIVKNKNTYGQYIFECI